MRTVEGMANTLNPLTTLHHVPLFSSCSKKDLARIVKVADEVTFKAGRVLTEQGQPGREAFIIVKGKATVRRNGKKLASIGAGANCRCWTTAPALQPSPVTPTVKCWSSASGIFTAFCTMCLYFPANCWPHWPRAFVNSTAQLWAEHN